MLRKSLESVKKLVFPDHIRVELLVIDNDEVASAKATINVIQQDFPCQINYFVEPERGISKARNRLLKEALNLGASHIALFDDDEILDSNWLISHNDYYNQNSEAFIISGPTYNHFEQPVPKYISKNNIFKSSTTKKTGLVRNSCASGNVFFPTTVMSETAIYFDESHVFMGGEDGDFFSRAFKAGFTIVWNNAAVNKELIGEDRANLRWMLNRYYYNGYSSAYLKLKNCSSNALRGLWSLKNSLVLAVDFCILLVSILLGPIVFFNALGILFKTKGKLDAIIQNRPLNYYENICGG